MYSTTTERRVGHPPLQSDQVSANNCLMILCFWFHMNSDAKVKWHYCLAKEIDTMMIH